MAALYIARAVTHSGAYDGDLPDRLAARITVDPRTGCWSWGGALDHKGYGRVKWNGRKVQVHRVVYSLLVDSTLPVAPGHDGRQLDHACRTRSCVNPEHLEPVTQRENTLRGLIGVLGKHSSRFVGVYWETRSCKWRASIWGAGRNRHLGYFVDEAAAAIAYDNAAEFHYGDRTNERLGLLAHFDGQGRPRKAGPTTDVTTRRLSEGRGDERT